MIVIKFGGTSVGDATRVGRAINIVADAADRKPVVIVSALAGVTNQLITATEVAASGDFEKVLPIIDEIRERHEDVAVTLVRQKSDFLESFRGQLHRQIEQIVAILRGISLVGDVSPRANDKIIAIGEKLSSVLFAYSLRLRTLAGVHIDSERVIVTDERFGQASPLMAETRLRARDVLLPEIDRNHIPVMGGFIGSSESGATTTLGRGGSDYSASIVGASLEAEEIQIWTDVDGMMTCDPRIIDNARIIDRISYEEAAELAWFGAKVLHPKTIAPAVDLHIPIRVLNTHNLDSRGTLITAEGDDVQGPRAIAPKKGITVVHISSNQMLGAHGVLARIFRIFERHEVSVDLITTSEVSVSVTIDDEENLPDVTRELEEFASVRIERKRAIIAVVGKNLMEDSSVGARLFDGLRGIPVSMMSLGSSGLNLSVVVAEENLDAAIHGVHRELFERPGVIA